MEKEKHGKKDKKGKGRGKGRGKGLPPGLAKRDSLPPGLQRQLERNGRLPPGLETRDLPDDLEKALPPPPKGTERVVAGEDVVLVDTGTKIILDVLEGVLSGSGKR